MAGFFQQFLKGVGAGFVDDMYLRDYQHASKIFRENGYANAPKFKWLFHVYFDINKTEVAGANIAKIFPDTTNYGLLVKSIDLPKYTISLTEMNQYNRKRLVQTKITYDPIRIVFHDDNASQIRQLWFNYFSYYYNDPNQPSSLGDRSFASDAPSLYDKSPDSSSAILNTKNTYDMDIMQDQNWGYIGETSSTPFLKLQKSSFFKSIKIFGFNQHNFVMYQLINPVIESFTHDNYNYYETRSTMESQMSIRYETVKYYDGALNGQKPSTIVDGFGKPKEYDTTLSPINRPGTNKTILGQGGLFDAGAGIINDISSRNYLGALQTAARTGRTFRNGRQILNAAKSELVGEVIGNIEKSSRNGFTFPAAGASATTSQQQTSNTNAKNAQANSLPTTQNNPGGLARPGVPGP
jgi:hypothetical protein